MAMGILLSLQATRDIITYSYCIKLNKVFHTGLMAQLQTQLHSKYPGVAHEIIIIRSYIHTIMEDWIYPYTTGVAEISHVVYIKYEILLLRENGKLIE